MRASSNAQQARMILCSGLSNPRNARIRPFRSIDDRSEGRSIESELLDRFWLSRGVHDRAQRSQLADLVLNGPPGNGHTSPSSAQLTALELLQEDIENTAETACALQRRLLDLHQLFGSRSDIDVVWMVSREPSLLTADFESLTQRIVQLRTAESATGLDIIKILEEQPGLLLQEEGPSDSGDEDSAQKRFAWQCGLLGDGDTEWTVRLAELREYVGQYGDAHVGFRDGDDPMLTRWAAKQRREHRSSVSNAVDRSDRWKALQEVGFEFDTEQAEWLRWYNELRTFKNSVGHCNPMPLVATSDFLLLNWCAVQRIANRSGVLAPDRATLLDELGFDWSGADALS